MLRLIIKQTKWGVFGAIFAFAIGFFVKIYLIDIVGLESWGKYVIALGLQNYRCQTEEVVIRLCFY